MYLFFFFFLGNENGFLVNANSPNLNPKLYLVNRIVEKTSPLYICIAFFKNVLVIIELLQKIFFNFVLLNLFKKICLYNLISTFLNFQLGLAI